MDNLLDAILLKNPRKDTVILSEAKNLMDLGADSSSPWRAPQNDMLVIGLLKTIGFNR
ncbi:MAG: hypothetical protein GYA34_01015 [Chloroflexi bacterium]|nr:hypothetical protein [Chloroflexota bacterium]